MAERKVKCKNCEKMIPKSIAYKFEYLDKNLNIKHKYYCDKECCDSKEGEKELLENIFKLLDDILEFPTRSNMYFNKMFKPIRDYYNLNVIYEFLKEEKNYLEVQLLKDFVTINAKVKYFFAIMQDKIDKYKTIIEDRKNRIEFKKELEVNYFEDDFIPVIKKDNKKMSLDDLLNKL